MKRKVCVVVASRANYGRIKATLKAIQQHPDLELQLVVTASALLSRFGKVADIIVQDGFKIDAQVYIVIEGENPTTMAKSTGLAIIELATIFERLRPDIVLTIADRYETLATAVAASYMNIPLAHTQGGEVTGSIDESVRHAITKLAHLHFPTTKISAERLVWMGEQPSSVQIVGCPAMDAICGLDLSITPEFCQRYSQRGTGASVDFTKPYIVVLQHPVTTEYGSGLDQIQETLKAITALQMQTVWLWPNVDAGSDDISKGIRHYREIMKPDFMHFYKNFPVEDYAVLINNCACLIGNSSSGIREGSFLGVPCVNIGTRQQNRERGKNVMDVPYQAVRILEAIRAQMAHGRYEPDTLYGDGHASEKIAEILARQELRVQKQLNYIVPEPQTRLLEMNDEGKLQALQSLRGGSHSRVEQSAKRILALIPARGGSKGLPGKNILPLMGKPLLSYSIEVAAAANCFTDIVVSTDSPQIAEIARHAGAWVPSLRPADLAGDRALTVDVVLHTLEELERDHQRRYDAVCLLQPTSPLRSVEDLRQCLELLESNSDCAIVTLSALDEPHPYKLKIIRQGRVYSFVPGFESGVPRQALPDVYQLNGAIYLAPCGLIKEHRSLTPEGRTVPLIMPSERSVNINRQPDFELAKVFLERKMSERESDLSN